MMRREERSRSPVSVQEWVAALPDISKDTESEESRAEERDNDIAEDDNLTLGAEAGGYYTAAPPVKNVGQLIFNKNNKSARATRGTLQHSDTSTSLKSDVSVSSMDSVLQSREADPEEVLINLGFAESEAFAKIPLRFLKQPSKAKGVSIENFKKNQEEIFGRYDSGFFGYRGLQGSLHRRPSELVDKILKTLRDRERVFQRTSSTFSTGGSHSIPSRFKIMDPNRTTFDSLVKQVAEKATEKEKPNSFRSLARSVLSPENRCWRQEQIQSNNKNAAAQQLLVLAGKSFVVDEEGNQEELSDRTCSLLKQNSHKSFLSTESGFNEDADSENYQGTREADRRPCRDSRQLLYSRCQEKYTREDCFSKKYQVKHCEGNKNAG